MAIPKRVLFLALSAVALLTGCTVNGIPGSTPNPTQTQTPVPSNISLLPSANGRIELGTFSFTPAPTVAPTAPPTIAPTDQPTPVPSAVCQPEGEFHNCVCPDISGSNPPIQESICTLSNGCAYVDACNACGWHPYCGVYIQGQPITIACQRIRIILNDGQPHCIGKPVIYLYPTHNQDTSVTLTIPGEITESIPTYPASGWRHVLAHPNGTLDYQGQTFPELYYESAVQTVTPPKTGVVIAAWHLRPVLTAYTTQLGLTLSEQQEFLDYWLPKLEALHSPYIMFSILDAQEKDRIDHVDISPKPTTSIAFLAYFKPLTAPILLQPLQLPAAPQRIGFTAVEWGGTIDQ